ncbi:MAG: DUF2497 domain-containing protein [Rhizobiaceae bacterium]|nr:DUF2497 domain-containing protein [Rhizobiaceae bacterium]
MAQATAQRDPSMEEILASIRKIIEEGEEIRQKPVESREDFSPTQIGPAANDVERRPIPAAAELSKEIPAVVPVKHHVLEEETSFPAATATKRERMSVEAALNELSLSLDDFTIEMDEMASAQAGVERVPQVESQKIIAGPVPVAEQMQAEGEDQIAASESSISGEFDSPRTVAAEAVDIPAVATSSVAHAVRKAAILSDAAGKQVAASFTELSEALAASRRRSLDEIAEEIMRPMLQEWLDNNLPTLVERLVREEIERVARGAS